MNKGRPRPRARARLRQPPRSRINCLTEGGAIHVIDHVLDDVDVDVAVLVDMGSLDVALAWENS